MPDERALGETHESAFQDFFAARRPKSGKLAIYVANVGHQPMEKYGKKFDPGKIWVSEQMPLGQASSVPTLNLCVASNHKAFRLRLRSRVACPELAEACPEPSRRRLSTNGVSFPL